MQFHKRILQKLSQARAAWAAAIIITAKAASNPQCIIIYGTPSASGSSKSQCPLLSTEQHCHAEAVCMESRSFSTNQLPWAAAPSVQGQQQQRSLEAVLAAN